MERTKKFSPSRALKKVTDLKIITKFCYSTYARETNTSINLSSKAHYNVV
jgi:hypothetical protein